MFVDCMKVHSIVDKRDGSRVYLFETPGQITKVRRTMSAKRCTRGGDILFQFFRPPGGRWVCVGAVLNTFQNRREWAASVAEWTEHHGAGWTHAELVVTL